MTSDDRTFAVASDEAIIRLINSARSRLETQRRRRFGRAIHVEGVRAATLQWRTGNRADNIDARNGAHATERLPEKK